MDEWRTEAVRNTREGLALLDKVVSSARSALVFGEPVTKGEHTIITASAMSVGMGFGFGSGYGGPGRPSHETTAVPEEAAEAMEKPEASTGAGSGGGGGGATSGRPVAIVELGPMGVRVVPVIDWAKVALAALPALGAVLGTLRAISRGSRSII